VSFYSDINKLVVEASEKARDFESSRRWLEQLYTLLINEKKLRGSNFVEISRSRFRGALVFGDIHGDLETFRALARRAGFGEIVESRGLLIFLGDYVDRGLYQLEVLILLAMLKYLLREKVVLLRGNHEPPPWLLPSPHDFRNVLIQRFGFSKGEVLYGIAQRIFSMLPVAAVIEGEALFVHGGPPISRLDRGEPREILDVDENDPEALEEILWSDPVEEDVEWLPSFRGAGKLYGPRVTEKTLRSLKVKVIIRGHEPCPSGYKLNHGGKVLTLFSLKGYPYYNEKAAVLRIDSLDNDWVKNLECSIVQV